MKTLIITLCTWIIARLSDHYEDAANMYVEIDAPQHITVIDLIITANDMEYDETDYNTVNIT